MCPELKKRHANIHTVELFKIKRDSILEISYLLSRKYSNICMYTAKIPVLYLYLGSTAPGVAGYLTAGSMRQTMPDAPPPIDHHHDDH